MVTGAVEDGCLVEFWNALDSRTLWDLCVSNEVFVPHFTIDARSRKDQGLNDNCRDVPFSLQNS